MTWSKPWVVAVNRDDGRVVITKQYIHAKWARKCWKKWVSDYPDRIVSLFFVQNGEWQERKQYNGYGTHRGLRKQDRPDA